MKLAKRVSILILAGLLFFGGVFATLNSNLYREKQQIKEETKIVKVLEEEDTIVDIEKKVLENKITLTKGAINSIREDISINLLELLGEQRATLNLKPEQSKMGQYFADSKTTINLKYRAKYSIYTEKINMYVDSGSGALIISIDNEDIKVDGITVDSYAVDSPNALFSKKLSEQQLFALVEKTSENIVDKMNENVDNIYISRKNLEKHIKGLCKEMGVELISFDNGKVVERLNSSPAIQTMSLNVKSNPILPNGTPINDYSNEVVYGVNNQKIDEVKAIVVHSTSNPNVGVKGHIKWGKENPDALLTMYYADSKEIGKTTKDDMAGYGIKSYKGYNNSNTVSVEICENDNEELQNKAIENSVELIKQLIRQYPNAKVVLHRDLTDYSKNCPRILFDNKGIELKDFEKMIGKSIDIEI